MLEVLESLNKAQYQAATTLDQHSMVLSCPGSGKTKTIEAKVVNLLHSIPSSQICCTTFSKSGATEIKERIYSAAKNIPKLKQRLTISTFHSLCFHTVKNYMNKPIKLVTEGERKYHIRGAAIDLRVDIKSDLFEIATSAIDSYATLTEKKYQSLPDMAHKIRARYKDRIHGSGKMDFEDLLVEAIELLESGKVKPSSYTHVLCDEAQDSDTLMYRWLMVYAQAGAVVTVMLDDDQTLYSFRNSLGVNICHKLEEDINAVTILNGTNYRSKEEVLIPARMLISRNLSRIDKDIVSHRGEGGSFNTYHLQSQSDTRNLIDDLVKEDPGSWFILCRTNSDIEQIANFLIELAIPYEGPKGTPLLERPEVEAFIEILNTIESRGGHGIDMVAIQCIAKESQIAEICTSKETQTLYEALKLGVTSKDLSSLNTQQQTKLTDLASKVVIWQDSAQEGRTNRAIRLCGQWLENNYPNDPSSIQSVMNILLGKTKGGISQRIMRLQQLLEVKPEEHTGVVTLMTGHSSKGLQRKNVLIWNCRDGAFPSKPNDNDHDHALQIEEERRILYVAMTRAEDNLHIVYQANKVNAKRITPYNVSSFISDMQIELGEPMRYNIPQ
jgi:superfamily I DNA/RNA helicase